MDRRQVLMLMGGAATVSIAEAQTSEPENTDADNSGEAVNPEDSGHVAEIAGEPNAHYAAQAEKFKPDIIETRQSPLSIVKPVRNDALPLRYAMEFVCTPQVQANKVLRKGDTFIVDFGGHRTGNFSFRLETEGREPDSPARLRLTFGEVPTDVAEDLYPYKGQLSSAWLPDEIINVDYLPQTVRMPRRYAFRYVKVEVMDTSPGFGVRFEDMTAHALTSAVSDVAPFKGTELHRKIDDISLATLRDCMQTSFEDGPRRDQRLWVGDLRLQALANYATFNQNDLVKRCLYLFAANPDKDGLVSACVYEYPEPRYGGIVIIDYALLFSVTLVDLVEATDDMETARDLWPAAKHQVEYMEQYISDAGLFQAPKNRWTFIDWRQELEKSASIQAISIFTYKKMAWLAEKLGDVEVAQKYAQMAENMTRAARATFFDRRTGLVVSGPERQVSHASQAWMTLAGVLTPYEARTALRLVMGYEKAVAPLTPYLYHYVTEALLMSGAQKEALELFESYWGGMVEAGADTFWEVYDPKMPLSSPYGDIHINSFCHAWSCTPNYLLRTLNIAG